jgi:cytoskeletal protein CcmA (bactofilin family)
VGVEDPADMEGTVVTEGPVVMEDITGVTEDPGVMEYTTAVVEGIMATEVIMAEAISMEGHASFSGDILGFLITIRTVIILTPIIILIPPHIPITRML